MEEAYSPAVQLLAQQMPSRAAVRAKWKQDAGLLINAHELAFSALASVVVRHQGQPINQPSEILEGQICLIAQFLIGIDLCETAISEGIYSQAAALLKQELETIAAIEEYREGTRKEGATPRIGRGVTSNFGPVYGKLNEISHVSRHWIAKDLVTGQVGELIGANILPSYNPNVARFLYGQHVHYITLAVSQADALFKALYGKGLSREEWQQVATARLLLLQNGDIEVHPEANGKEADWLRNMVAEIAAAKS